MKLAPRAIRSRGVHMGNSHMITLNIHSLRNTDKYLLLTIVMELEHMLLMGGL